MPGFLGSSRSFNERFSRPILEARAIAVGQASGGRSAARNAIQLESAARALALLHRQVDLCARVCVR